MTWISPAEAARALPPYDRACQAEDALEAVAMPVTGLDLLNTIRLVVDDLDHLSEEEHRSLIETAFNRLFEAGGVEYDVSVGDYFYSTVRDAVTDALRAAFPTPFEISEEGL